MKKLILISVFLLLINSGCQSDSFQVYENQEDQNLEAVELSLNTNPYILTALVDEGWCPNGRKYSIYASSGLKKYPEDLIVYVYIVHSKNGIKSIVDAAILTLPANETKTNNIMVFNYATEEYGKVEVKVAEVQRGNSYITDQLEIRNTAPTVRNCYNPTQTGPTNCFQTDGDSSPSDFESAGDSDGDGVCDNKDKDDDNDLIPDIVDEDDDGDGIPDDEEDDEDSNDGGTREDDVPGGLIPSRGGTGLGGAQ